jgi:guanylate kinase
MAVLEKRLAARGTNAAGDITRRIRNAEWEMGQQHRYDHVVVNDRLEPAVDRLVSIIESHRSGGNRRGGRA